MNVTKKTAHTHGHRKQTANTNVHHTHTAIWVLMRFVTISRAGIQTRLRMKALAVRLIFNSSNRQSICQDLHSNRNRHLPSVKKLWQGSLDWPGLASLHCLLAYTESWRSEVHLPGLAALPCSLACSKSRKSFGNSARSLDRMFAVLKRGDSASAKIQCQGKSENLEYSIAIILCDYFASLLGLTTSHCCQESPRNVAVGTDNVTLLLEVIMLRCCWKSPRNVAVENQYIVQLRGYAASFCCEETSRRTA